MSESNKREVVRIELAQYPSHPKWIRGTPDPKKVDEMRASLKALGQLVALVAIANPKSLIDGNMRAHCMRLEGWTHADAVLLDHEPTLQEVLEMQLGFEVRSNVPVTVRARTLAAIQEAGSYTVSALALRMGMTQSWCSQLLAVNKARAAGHDVSSVQRYLSRGK